ncbi:uncharacterized protein N7484_003122 [Penicillium longicatenatum]|uniref:uncharacterized protein n=1 Tax=Penicillium longicatenatum TaxID=1561947 RepID=UPI002549189D|nr:uncharacterized protein N7484_003122 [Penicillium longicatenatum]KAJ5649399.1 hypothetical protein N7484_003122 [Penicillium longicatenatum]
MDDQRDSYVKWRECDKLPDTPQVVLELDGCPTVWTEPEIQDYFLSHLRRLMSDESNDRDDQNESDSSNDINQPCWLRWSPLPIDPALDDFILLHHDPDSKILQRIGVEKQPIYEPSRSLHMFPNEPHSSWTREAKETHDRHTVTHRLSIPGAWKKLLQPGHSYDLLWTGKEVAHWGWGKPPQVGKEASEPKRPPVLIPGGAHFTFTVVEALPPPIPHPATPPPFQACERVPGAPVLSLDMSCSPTMTLNGRLRIHIRLTYHGLSDSSGTTTTGKEEPRPITFHTYAFSPVDGAFRVYRRTGPDQPSSEIEEKWESFYGNGCRWGLWGDPDQPINVSQNLGTRFQTLFPGACWTNFWTMEADGDGLPEDPQFGEKFRYQFKGNTLDWWDWGTAEDHAETVVTIPAAGVDLLSIQRTMEAGQRWLYPRRILWSG